MKLLETITLIILIIILIGLTVFLAVMAFYAAANLSQGAPKCF